MKQRDQQHELLMAQNMVLVNQSKAMLLKLDLQHHKRSNQRFDTPPSRNSPPSLPFLVSDYDLEE